jgi:hypothetical protein
MELQDSGTYERKRGLSKTVVYKRDCGKLRQRERVTDFLTLRLKAEGSFTVM